MFDVAASPEWMSHPDRPCAPGPHATPREIRDHADKWFAQGVYATPAYAKQLCAGCPVSALCLDKAMRDREEGIWGGTTDVQRETIRRRNRDKKKAAA